MKPVKENVTQAADWLNGKLIPLLGPAPIGPYGTSVREDAHPGEADQLCPICYHAMSRHVMDVDEETKRVYLACPGTGVEFEVEHHEQEKGTLDRPVLS